MEYKETQRVRDYNNVCNELEAFYHQIAIKLGLSDSAVDILTTILDLGEGCSQTEIFKKTFLNKQTVNSSVKQLINKKILYFKPKNNRENEIYFTDFGKKFVEEKIIPLIQIDEEIYSEMSEEEYMEMLNLTKKYLQVLKDKLGPIYDIK